MSDAARMPSSYDEDLAREPVFTSETPCPECGCDPGQPWGCGCNNSYCPCSEEEDDDD
jgi:hypothetical protein